MTGVSPDQMSHVLICRAEDTCCSSRLGGGRRGGPGPGPQTPPRVHGSSAAANETLICRLVLGGGINGFQGKWRIWSS